MNKYESYIKICVWIITQEGFLPVDVQVKSRKREIVFTRQLAMYFARRFTRASFSLIGSYFSKDHATVLHACKTVSNLIDTDRMIRAKVKDYEIQLRRLQESPVRRMLIFRVYPMTRFAYLKVKTPEEITLFAIQGARAEDITREIVKTIRYEKYFSKFNN